jgi:hypothetical protein
MEWPISMNLGQLKLEKGGKIMWGLFVRLLVS